MRGVELEGAATRPKLKAFGQVGLPSGAVVEGEVRDPEVVSEAIRRLWSEAGFSTRRVVVGIGGQRVILREADVTAMSVEDFRTAMSFEVQDLIPIPVADAVLDFQVLGAAAPGSDGRERMRILLAAADRQAIDRLLAVLDAGGVEPVAIDVPPAAALRAAGAEAFEGAVGLVTIGADLTNVALRIAGKGVYSRTLAVGAAQLTAGLAHRLGASQPEAEAVKRYASDGGKGAARVAALVAEEVRPVVEQICESLEYFLSQSTVDRIDSVLVTGGGSLTPGLVERLGAAVGAPVSPLDPFTGLALDGSRVAATDLRRARPFALGATGLAQWAAMPAGGRLSLLPPEIGEARRRRQATIGSVAAVAVLAVSLAGVWYAEHAKVTSVDSQTAAVVAANTRLRQSSASLSSATGYIAAVKGREAALARIGAGIDWPALIRQVSGAMPASTVLGNVTVSTPEPTASVTAVGSAAASAPAAATITMSVQGPGGVDLVATWLRAMAKVPSLTDVWVAGSTSDGVTDTFSCTATVTSRAPSITYAWEKYK